MHVNAVFSHNEQYILSTVSVGTLSIQQNKCTMMKETMDKSPPMNIQKAWNGLKPTADDLTCEMKLVQQPTAVMFTLQQACDSYSNITKGEWHSSTQL